MNENFEGELEPASPAECAICLVDHDEAIHAATLRLRAWFRLQVIRNLDLEIRHDVAA